MSRRGLKNSSVWVLLSGGIDSAACLDFYLEEGYAVGGLFIDYGQTAVREEKEAAVNVAQHYGIKLEMVKYSGLLIKGAGVIRGRNAFLLLTALMELPEDVGTIAIGIHSGTSYADCTPQFASRMHAVFDMYTGGGVQVGTPFLKWTKRDIWDFAKARKVPIEMTYSCENGLLQPCGRCLSCNDLEELYARTKE